MDVISLLGIPQLRLKNQSEKLAIRRKSVFWPGPPRSAKNQDMRGLLLKANKQNYNSNELPTPYKGKLLNQRGKKRKKKETQAIYIVLKKMMTKTTETKCLQLP